MKTYHLDARRGLLLPGNEEQCIKYATDHWVQTAKAAIKSHGFFAVALSGGSTPKKIFQQLFMHHKSSLDWSKVYLFWSDERSVLPSDPESNFHMAMIEANLTSLPFDPKKIFRMVAEKEIEANAHAYEETIRRVLKTPSFDLIMLGVGEDGHTASLFPHTKALAETQKLVAANYVPEKGSWRMTFTYPLINQAKSICLYAIGKSKAEIVEKVLFSPPDPLTYPSQNIGTTTHPAHWIIDSSAAEKIANKINI